MTTYQEISRPNKVLYPDPAAPPAGLASGAAAELTRESVMEMDQIPVRPGT